MAIVDSYNSTRVNNDKAVVYQQTTQVHTPVGFPQPQFHPNGTFSVVQPMHVTNHTSFTAQIPQQAPQYYGQPAPRSQFFAQGIQFTR